MITNRRINEGEKERSVNRIKSYEPTLKGKLYLVGTPIGNLKDLTARAQEALAHVDLIAAEDTRVTRKLLTHFGIHTPLISYHEHSGKARMGEILEKLEEGKEIALVSDAGLPGISDPGERLIAECTGREIPVIPIPGPSAALSALIASGLPIIPHLFIGFLPRERKERRELLNEWRNTKATLLFFESPYRVTDTLKEMLEVFGNRRVVLARELTKLHEEWIRGDFISLLSALEGEEMRGEFTMVVEGAKEETAPNPEEKWWMDLSLNRHVGIWIEKGYRTNEAIKKVAEERGLPKREVYQQYHLGKENEIEN